MFFTLVSSALVSLNAANGPVVLPPRRLTEADGVCTLQCWVVPVDGEGPGVEIFLSAARWGSAYRAAVASGMLDDEFGSQETGDHVFRALAIVGEEGFGPFGSGRPVQIHFMAKMDGLLSQIPKDGSSGEVVEKRIPTFLAFDCVPAIFLSDAEK